MTSSCLGKRQSRADKLTRRFAFSLGFAACLSKNNK
nr:MAG TPA: hypothetical protein [Bacteriophage sp.]